MSSRSKNFRRRADDDDNEGNDINGSGVPAKSTPAIPIKFSSKATSSNKPKKNHQKLLSFAEDEESESPFSRPQKSSTRLSKNTSSHKITSFKDRGVPSSVSVTSNVQPQAGQYTKEALLELQKNTKTLVSSRPRPPALDPKLPSSEPVIVLKGLVKPVLGTGKDVELSEEKSVTNDDSVSQKREEGDRRLGLMGKGKGEVLDELDSDIPDQATINAIRAKRERLRQSRAAAPDYISLDGGSNHGAAEGLSDEEPEFQTRIAMLGEKTDDVKKGVFEDVDERPVRVANLSLEDDDDDEEERKWEEEQFRKGLGKRMDEGPSGMSKSTTAVQPAQLQTYMYATPDSYSSAAAVSAGPPSIGGAVGVLHGIEAIPITQQAEIAKQALQDNMKRLKESHVRAMTSLAVADENLATSLIKISSLEESLSAAGDKYIFMQKLREFIAVICEFLQEKAPYIEELEEQMQELHKKRASVTVERRVADTDDEMIEVQAAIDAAMSVLGKGGSNPSTVAAAMSAAQAAAAAVKQKKHLPELDEFGRDINLQKRLDMTRRAESRERKRARSDNRRMLSAGNEVRMEGESSTDESDNEGDAYKSNRDQLLQVAEDVFGDAEQEYSQLSLVKGRFEKWKRLYAGSYRDAYMSLSIPAIFSPYVRLELLKWDPLHEDVDFYDMRWHSLLFDYGVPEDGSDFNRDDMDADLVPGLVEKVALPILHHDIAHCWDVLSTKETKNAVAATNLIINYVPATSEPLKELIVAVRTRLAEAVSNLVVPSWSAVVMRAVPNAARIAAYRFGVALRLMRNICMWKDVLAMPILEKLALDELLYSKALPHVQNLTTDIYDAITRTERIISALAGVWTGPSITGARSRKLQPMVDYVRTLAKTLLKKHASGVAESETAGLARRLKKMMVELNEYDEARSISRTFNLKEAL